MKPHETHLRRTIRRRSRGARCRDRARHRLWRLVPEGRLGRGFTAPPGLLAKYPDLQETPLADPAQRTEWNVRDADACMIVVEAGGVDMSAGTALPRNCTSSPQAALGRDLGDVHVKHARLWLRVQQARHGDDLRLAIGGPRESEAHGIYERATAFIRALLGMAIARKTRSRQTRIAVALKRLAAHAVRR